MLGEFTYDNKHLDCLNIINALIPPAGDSSRLKQSWSAEIRNQIKVLAKTLKKDDCVIICGISYRHVDRKEIDTYLSKMQLYYKNSVSHLYAMWMFAFYIFKENKDVNLYEKCFLDFYIKVKQKETNPYIQKYIQSMQQSTKSMGSRKKRFKALLGYMQENVEK